MFIKKFLKSVIYLLISLVEYLQYFRKNIDENDETKKILKSTNLTGIYLDTDTGFKKATYLHLTQPYREYILITNRGIELRCADNHIVFDSNYNEVYVKNLKKGDKIITINGIETIYKLKKTYRKLSMYDFTIGDDNHRYYTNGVLSHNTITSAIYLLHYILFNNKKNVLIAANVGDTAKEILSKVKDIYQSLPFFLQKGVEVWNEKTIKFDNDSRAKSFTMTKTSSIGQAADLVYLDEFAYIPDTIANDFYKSIQPTLVSIENSKMIITSTPNGMNLFHDLFVNAERPEGDPLKNNFKALRVYWHQVPGRNVFYIKLNEFKLKKYSIEFDEVYNYIQDLYDPNGKEDVNGVKYVKKVLDSENDIFEIHVLNREGVEYEDIASLKILNNDNKKIPLGALGEISSWKLDAIKDVGGIEAFNQEYDLRFINASKSLFKENLLKKIESEIVDFNFKEHDIFEPLRWDYTDLRFSEDESIFKEENRKKYKIIMSVDVSEGLGQDYSVINIFRIDKKDNETIEKQKDLYQSFTDFFCLKQIGIFRSNIVSIEKLSEMLYLLGFEYFNEDNVKIVLELNNHGHAVLESIRSVFNNENNYGSFIFFRFKHRKDSTERKIGLKVSSNKKILVKQYQERIESSDIKIYDKDTHREMTTFIKNEKRNGNITYEADGSSNDDIVMTIVNLTEVFKDNIFKDMIEEYWKSLNDNKLTDDINKILENNEYTEGIDYNSFFKAKNNSRRKRF